MRGFPGITADDYQSSTSIQNMKSNTNILIIFILVKGKLYKGTPFNYLKGTVEDKSKI